MQIASKPLRFAMRWQALATMTMAIGAAGISGFHGAVSALLGGGVSWLASWVFVLLISRFPSRTAGQVIRTALRAEAGKVALIVIMLWGVLSIYNDIVPALFFGSFVVTVITSQMAVLVRDN